MLMDVPVEGGGVVVQNMPVRPVAWCGGSTLITWKERSGVIVFGIIPGLRWNEGEVRWVHDPDEAPRVQAEMTARLELADFQARVPRIDLRLVYRREGTPC